MLAELDVLVVPSRWVENSPNVILEAQAMGVPVVGIATSAASPELVTHEQNGLLFETDNAADLARQLQRLLDDPGLAPPAVAARPPPLRTVEDELRRARCGCFTDSWPDVSTGRNVALP